MMRLLYYRVSTARMRSIVAAKSSSSCANAALMSNVIAIDRRGAAPLEPMHRSTKVQCLGAAGFFIALYALNVCRRRVCRAEQRGRP